MKLMVMLMLKMMVSHEARNDARSDASLLFFFCSHVNKLHSRATISA